MTVKRVRWEREIPSRLAVDVLVVGGGPAGIAASLSAARLGASVLLVEQQGCLGGLGTSGLVPGFCPMSDGERVIVGGIGREVVDRLRERGGTGADDGPEQWDWIAFNPESLKVLYDEMVGEAGVGVRFFTTLVDVLVEGRQVRGAVFSGRSGPYAVEARTFVDATGDGLLSYLSGAACEIGDEAGRLQPPTLCSIFAGVDWETFKGWREGDQPGAAVQRAVEQAIKEGFFSSPDRHHSGAWRTGRRLAGMNVGHAHGVNGADDEQLTEGIIRARRVVQENFAFYRKYVRGFEEAELAATAALLGVRETRRVVADYMLSEGDFVARRSFADQIGRYNYPIDLHPPAATDADYEAFLAEFRGEYVYGAGQSYGIPLRSLIVRDLDNVMVAGRCMGTDRKMQGSTRVMPCCFITGQAAGVAAAMAAGGDGAVRKVESGLVVEGLRKDGAYVPRA
ncbi:MAG: FAD-dependent oxidoreductase [Phycisphaerae bacterium]|nr:FAD-dependent oxidoreductase [Phycisphaerae bacterium]